MPKRPNCNCDGKKNSCPYGDQIESQLQHCGVIRQQDLLYKSILGHALNGYWDWNVKDQTVYLSPQFKLMLGYADSEFPNSVDHWLLHIYPEDISLVMGAMEDHLSSNGVVPLCQEVRYRHKNGSTVRIICSGSIVQWDQAGKPHRVVGCHVDVSDDRKEDENLSPDKRTLTSEDAPLNEAIFDIENEKQNVSVHAPRVVMPA